MAAGTGVGVQFSSGDEGDNFIVTGEQQPSFPGTSPYATAVGGTSVEIGAQNNRLGEVGWSTGISTLCTEELANLAEPGCEKSEVGQWLPPAPGEYDYGGGGGTTNQYAEPWYQQPVVPAELAAKAGTGVPNRVVPDISMEGDPSTGMLVGETQEFADGTYYDQYRIGGTSLSSPLFAGLMADADQAARGSLGFVNPLLYHLDSGAQKSAAFYDILPAGQQAVVRNDYLNGENAEAGILTTARILGMEGATEYFCDEENPETGECEAEMKKHPESLSAAPGFDSMTGIGSPGDQFIQELHQTLNGRRPGARARPRPQFRRSAAQSADPGWRSGIRPVRKRPTRARIASTASAVRSPTSRADSFSSTIAAVASGVTWASSSSVSSSASEMNGTPPASLVERRRLDRRRDRVVLLHPGEEGGAEGGDHDRAGQRGADRDAEVGDRVLQAADLAALLVGDRGDGDAAELRGERAHAEAGQQHRPGRDPGAGTLLEAGDEDRQGRRTSRGSRAARRDAARRGGRAWGSRPRRGSG